MTLPTGWPPRAPSGRRSIRVYITAANSTIDFSDNAYLFASAAAGSANTFTPLPQVATGHLTSNSAMGTELTSANTVVPITPQGTGETDPNSPTAMIWSGNIRVKNLSATVTDAIEFSFDGTNVHGKVFGGESITYFTRHEAGIAVRAAVGTPGFIVEAW